MLRCIPLVAVVALALTACSDQPTAPHQDPGSAPHASGSTFRVAMHRLFNSTNNDHLYSVYEYAGGSAYTLENYEYFFLEAFETSGHVPVYFCSPSSTSTSGDHWLSTDPDCEDRDVTVVQGHSGWIATSQLTGTVPLYSQYNPVLDDTFHTISLSEAQYADANYGYSTPVVIGYVYTSE
jgi:hypothetical protein